MYDIRLYPAANVTIDADGVVTFADADGTPAGSGNGEADRGTVNAVIEVVNGVGVTLAQAVEATSTAGGDLSFTIDSTTPDDVIPVVFLDTEDDSNVELNADNEPTEAVGVGGQKTWIPAEAPNGASGAVWTASVSKAGDAMVVSETAQDLNEDTDTADGGEGAVDLNGDGDTTDLFTVFYDSNDVFQRGGNPVTMDNFEANLNHHDGVNIVLYANDPALQSTFNLVLNNPLDPTVGAAATANAQQSTTVTVTPVAPTYAEMEGDDEFVVYRAMWDPASDGDSDNNCDTFQADADGDADDDDSLFDTAADYEEVFRQTKAAEAAVDVANGVSNNVFTFVDSEQEPGCYAYVGSVVIDGDESPIDSNTDGFYGDEAAVRSVGVGDSVAPTLTDTRLTTDGGTAAVIDEGDVIRLRFSEAMQAPNNGDRIRFTDPQGQIWEIQLAAADDDATPVNGQATWIPANYTPTGSTTAITNGQLTLTLVDDPVLVGGPTPATGAADAEVPSNITDFTPNSLEDVAGNDLDLAGSADVSIDNEL